MVKYLEHNCIPLLEKEGQYAAVTSIDEESLTVEYERNIKKVSTEEIISDGTYKVVFVDSSFPEFNLSKEEWRVMYFNCIYTAVLEYKNANDGKSGLSGMRMLYETYEEAKKLEVSESIEETRKIYASFLLKAAIVTENIEFIEQAGRLQRVAKLWKEFLEMKEAKNNKKTILKKIYQEEADICNSLLSIVEAEL
jgi:hypothetical protein